MNNFKARLADSFKKVLKRVKKNFDLIIRCNDKIKEIIENPYHYKPLRNVLKNRFRTHNGSYAEVFESKKQDTPSNLKVCHPFKKRGIKKFCVSAMIFYLFYSSR